MQKRWSALVVVIAMLVPGLFSLSPVTNAQATSCLVVTANGMVQGIDNGVSCSFLGIPFAAPPLGNLRWKPPQPAAPWAPSTLMATVAPPACPQFNPPTSSVTAGNENCLRLNVWTPGPLPASPVPVIVWIHTGAFIGASANFADSNPRNLVELTGVIVVTANYRLGPFGFMGHPALTAEDPSHHSSGNYGFLDQRAAMAWVRDHIAAFGGDPDNVTIAGQSAGGHSVSFHVVSPGSAGYFRQAIMDSGYASSRQPTLTDAENLGTGFAATVGCFDPAHVLECMRSKTQAQVLLAFPNGLQEFAQTPRIPWGPVVDGVDIPDQPRALYEDGAFNHVPLIIGSTRDEGWIYADRSYPGGLTTLQYEAAVTAEFGAAARAILAQYPAADFASPKLALSQLTGDVEAMCEVRRVARLVERTGTPVFQYSFDREVPAVAGDQVIHGIDRNFLFGNNYVPPSPPYVLNADDLALFRTIAGYWTRFAATGNPNSDDEGVVHWPAFKHPSGKGRGSDKYLVLDVPVHEGKRLREAACDFWEPFFFRSIATGPVPAGQ